MKDPKEEAELYQSVYCWLFEDYACKKYVHPTGMLAISNLPNKVAAKTFMCTKIFDTLKGNKEYSEAKESKA